MATPLPGASDFPKLSINKDGFHAKFLNLLAYLSGLLGTDGNASTARTALGLGTAATRDSGVAAGNVPLVGTASATDTTAGLVELASAAEAPDRTKNAAVLTPATLRDAFAAQNAPPIYACRAWVNFNGAGTVTIRESGNVSSITDNGTGDYTVNFTTAMPDANYAATFGGNASSVSTHGYLTLNQNTPLSSTGVRMQGANGANAAIDMTSATLAVFR